MSCLLLGGLSKGKSGCPVRPPEPPSIAAAQHTSPDPRGMRYTLETISEEDTANHFSDSSPLVSKKSRLTMDLNDILSDRNTLSYFVQYMESNSAIILIKFWLDIEHFKRLAAESLSETSHLSRGKLTRTTSFESSVKPTQRFHSKTFIFKGINNLNASSSNEGSGEPVPPYDCTHGDETRINGTKVVRESRPIVDHAIDLFKKYIALEAPHRLDLPDNIRNIVISNICHPEGLVKANCFKVAQDIVHRQLESAHLEGFLRSPLYTKAQVDILTNGSLTLDDILFNEMTLFYFTEFLEQESCSILLEFLMALLNFSDNLINSGAYDPAQAQDDAIILYDKYFSLQASNPIGFPMEVRSVVEENICRDGGPLPDCFHTPFRIVYKTLTKYVKTFLESELYFKYLSEMINSVDKSWLPHKKSLSECSSEFSINTQNTLLAMGDPHYRSRRRNHSVPDMSIDSNQLYNADSLWHRKKQDGLSLGRINSLGRFESKLEPDPDKKETSMLRRMVSKLVPSAAPRVEEEMAWQVAHMIVKDITDLTMAPPDSDT